MKRVILTGLLVLGSGLCSADMPYISNNTAETFERVTSGDITCESRKAHPTLNAGLYQSNDSYYGSSYQNDDKGVYVALSIPITMNRNQVDCSSLYNTALDKERIRVKQLEMQLEMYKGRRLVAN